MEKKPTEISRDDQWSIVRYDDNSVSVTRYPSMRTVAEKQFGNEFAAKLWFDYMVDEKGTEDGR
jgi:hypothetical protein